MGGCRVEVLGGFAVLVDGRPVPPDAWRSRRASDLVKMLALEPGHALHREQVMDALWPALEPEAAGANLRKAIHYARRAMGSDEAIAATGSLLSLWSGRVTVDAREFLTAADAALASGDPARCQSAADLYPADPLPADRYEDWVQPARKALRERHLAVLKGAQRWQAALDIDPTDEESHQALMRRHFEAGRRRDAIRQFERLREALREHIGVGPAPETLDLYVRILDMEGAEPRTPAQQAALLVANGLVHMGRGELAEAESLARQAKDLAAAAGLGHELGEAGTLLALVATWSGRWPEVFRQEFQEAMRSDDLTLAAWDANVCFAEYHTSGTGGHEGWAAYAGELLALARDAHSVPGQGVAHLMVGEALMAGGSFSESWDEFERALSLDPLPCVASLALEYLARLAVVAGRPGQARGLLDQALPTAQESDLRSHLVVRLLGVDIEAARRGETLSGGARLAGAAGRAVAQAERRLADMARVCDPCSMHYHLQAASASARTGELGRARRHLADAERISGLWQGGPWGAAVWEGRAALRLAEGEPAQAAAFLVEAAAAFAAAHRPVDEARCRSAAHAVEIS